MAEVKTVTAGPFVVGVGRSGGFRVIAAPEWMIRDGTYVQLRDASTLGLDSESVLISPSVELSAVAEYFAVEGPDYGLQESETLFDDMGRRFDAIRGLVLASGPCVILEQVDHLLDPVPGLYRSFLASEAAAPLATEEVTIVVRPIGDAEDADPVAPPAAKRPGGWILPTGLTLAVGSLLTWLLYFR